MVEGTEWMAVILVQLQTAELLQRKRRHVPMDAFALLSRMAELGTARVESQERRREQLVAERLQFAESQRVGYLHYKTLKSMGYNPKQTENQTNSSLSKVLQRSSSYQVFPDDAKFQHLR